MTIPEQFAPSVESLYVNQPAGARTLNAHLTPVLLAALCRSHKPCVQHFHFSSLFADRLLLSQAGLRRS